MEHIVQVMITQLLVLMLMTVGITPPTIDIATDSLSA